VRACNKPMALIMNGRKMNVHYAHSILTRQNTSHTTTVSHRAPTPSTHSPSYMHTFIVEFPHPHPHSILTLCEFAINQVCRAKKQQ